AVDGNVPRHRIAVGVEDPQGDIGIGARIDGGPRHGEAPALEEGDLRPDLGPVRGFVDGYAVTDLLAVGGEDLGEEVVVAAVRVLLPDDHEAAAGQRLGDRLLRALARDSVDRDLAA